MKNWQVMAWLGLVLASGLLIMAGETDEDVDLGSVMEVWSDVVRDVDEFGLQLTRVSAEEEMRIGREMVAGWWSPDEEHAAWQAYVDQVGSLLTPYVYRHDMSYEFHVIESGEVNAFALPGGQIGITTGLLEAMDSEAELAAVLGHEIAHVDARHCIENYQYEIAMEKAGIGQLGSNVDFLRRFASMGYSKYQEHEADAQGVRISIQAGYDPLAVLDLMDRVLNELSPPERPSAEQPIDEVLGAVLGALQDYSRSHPYTADRIKRLRRLAEDQWRHMGQSELYIGRANIQRRQAKSALFLTSELTTLQSR